MQQLPSDEKNAGKFAEQAAAQYRQILLEDIMPFWMRHGIDKEHGGIHNMLDDAGNVVGTDKFLWSQGRGLWTFSALMNRVERRPEWRAFADHIFNFLTSREWRDEQGRWPFRLDKAGQVCEGNTSIYVDGFVLTGLAEYYAATGSELALTLALETFENVRNRLAIPGGYKVAPYQIPPGMKTHGVAMAFSLFFYDLGQILSRQDIQRAGLEYAYQVLNHFYRAEKNAIVEFVTLNGKYSDTPEGRACVPGHAVESLWFLISIFERSGDAESIRRCCKLIKRHLELGWDEEFGGLILAIDIDGVDPPYWKFPTHKPWWVQAEALVATAYAHLHTGEEWCLEWHRRIQEFALKHYPVPTGEWTPWVDRRGQRMGNAVLPVKDPFHLPRALMHLIRVFDQVNASCTSH